MGAASIRVGRCDPRSDRGAVEVGGVDDFRRTEDLPKAFGTLVALHRCDRPQLFDPSPQVSLAPCYSWSRLATICNLGRLSLIKLFGWLYSDGCVLTPEGTKIHGV